MLNLFVEVYPNFYYTAEHFNIPIQQKPQSLIALRLIFYVVFQFTGYVITNPDTTPPSTVTVRFAPSRLYFCTPNASSVGSPKAALMSLSAEPIIR